MTDELEQESPEDAKPEDGGAGDGGDGDNVPKNAKPEDGGAGDGGRMAIMCQKMVAQAAMTGKIFGQ